MERITSSPLCAIVRLALSVPACFLVNLCFTLLGHLLFLVGSAQDAHIRTIPVLSSIAVGAIGGAIWGGVCLATIVILYMIHGVERYGIMPSGYRHFNRLITSPPIGVAVMRGNYQGNVLAPLTAIWASLVGASTVCFVILCLLTIVVQVIGL
jgi:hypothetical protein